MYRNRVTRSVIAASLAAALVGGCGAVELEPSWRADFDKALSTVGDLDGGAVTPKTAAAAGMAICAALDAGAEMPAVAKRWDEQGYTIDFLIEAIITTPQICPDHSQAIDRWVLG